MHSFICLFTYLLGVDLLATFEKELMRHEKNRQELANAEKLFDLPITMYPELLKVQKEMSGLKMIYELYDALKVNVYPWTLSPRRGCSSIGLQATKSLYCDLKAH